MTCSLSDNIVQYPKDYFIDDDLPVDECLKRLQKYLHCNVSMNDNENSFHDSVLVQDAIPNNTKESFLLNEPISGTETNSKYLIHKKPCQNYIKKCSCKAQKGEKIDLENGKRQFNFPKESKLNIISPHLGSLDKANGKKISTNVFEANLQGKMNDDPLENRQPHYQIKQFECLSSISIFLLKENSFIGKKDNTTLHEIESTNNSQNLEAGKNESQVKIKKRAKYNKPLDEVLSLLQEWRNYWGKSKMIYGKLSNRNMKATQAAAKVGISKKTLDYYQGILLKCVYCKDKIDILSYLHKSFGNLSKEVQRLLPIMDKKSEENKKLKKALKNKDIQKALDDLISSS